MTWVPVPTAVGSYVTGVVQLALFPLPVSVHVPVNVPLPLLEKMTVPVGVVGAVALVSVTIAVQLVELSAMIVVGWHVSFVVVV